MMKVREKISGPLKRDRNGNGKGFWMGAGVEDERGLDRVTDFQGED